MKPYRLLQKGGNQDFINIYGAYNQFNKKRGVLKATGKAVLVKQSTTISQNVRKSLIDLPSLASQPGTFDTKTDSVYCNDNVYEISDLIINTK
jgi:hypothetical protein